MPPDDPTFARDELVLGRRLGSSTLVLRVDGGDPDVLELEGFASLVWTALAAPASAREIAEDLRSIVPDELDVEEHIDEALDLLVGASLVSVVRGQG